MITGCGWIDQLLFPSDSILITEEIPLRETTPGELFLTRWFTVTYFGENVLLSANPDGTGEIWVDDAISFEVTHPDGTKAQKVIDFSFGCQGWISKLPPQTLTSLFTIGQNFVTVKAFDICGDVLGSSNLYLVVERGRIVETGPFESSYIWTALGFDSRLKEVHQ